MGEAEVGSKRAREDDGDARPSFERPTEAGAIEYCELWYYRDNEGNDQGPQPATSMRSWVEAGYFGDSNLVAPSHFGEVPETFWRIDELWEDVPTQAFVLLKEVVDIVPEVLPEYQPCAEFAGAREKYVFKNGFFGNGYYLDQPPVIEVTAQSLEKEKEDRETTVKRLQAAQHYAGEGPS